MAPRRNKTTLKVKITKPAAKKPRAKRTRKVRKMKPLICVYDYLLKRKTRLNLIQKEVLGDAKLLFHVPIIKFESLRNLYEPEVIVIEDDDIIASQEDPEPDQLRVVGDSVGSLASDPWLEPQPGPSSRPDAVENEQLNFVVSDVRSYNGADPRSQTGTIRTIFSAIKCTYPTIPSNNMNIGFVWDIHQVQV